MRSADVGHWIGQQMFKLDRHAFLRRHSPKMRSRLGRPDRRGEVERQTATTEIRQLELTRRMA